MNGRAGKGVLKTLPKRRHSRTVATTADVYLPSIRWTPELINQVASLLADALVRDLPTHSPRLPHNET